jgi:hypothetical protein
MDKMLFITTTSGPSANNDNNGNSPYVILINEDSSSADELTENEEPKSSLTNSDRSALNGNPVVYSSSKRISNSICFVFLFSVIVRLALK